MLYTNYQDMDPLCNAPNSLYLHGVILRAFLIYSQNTTYPLHIFGREKKKPIKFQNSNYYDIPHTPQTDKDGLSLKLLDYILQITFLTVDDLKSPDSSCFDNVNKSSLPKNCPKHTYRQEDEPWPL